MNKYVCPTCGVFLCEPYIKCAECQNPTMMFCLRCFAKGKEYGEHRNDHSYMIMKNNFSLFDSSWSAHEELKLLSAIQEHGFGNWNSIAVAVGTKSKNECMNHYCYYYLTRPKPPLPVLKPPETVPKKPCIPIPFIPCKDPPRPPDGSLQFNEMAGYMPARGEFCLEYDDFLEMSLNNVVIETNADPVTMDLQMAVLRIFCQNLKKRARHKCILRRYGLISSQKTFEEWRRYHVLGKNVIDNMKTLMRLMKPVKFDEFMEGILCEERLKQRIKILQECRRAGITRLRSINTYLKLKQKYELRLRHRTLLDEVLTHVKDDSSRNYFIQKQVLNENSQGLPSTIVANRRSAPPLSVIGLPGYEKLSEKERELCSVLRIYPTAYLQYKGTLLHEYRKLGSLRLANARSVIKIDVNKTRKIYDLLLEEGAITKDSS